MSSPAPLPEEIHRSAERGELQKVVKWLRKGGRVDAFVSITTRSGRASTSTLLLTAAANGHLAMVRELLKRGASIDLPSGLGWTALLHAACGGHLSVVLVLLQHSANTDLQEIDGYTALMAAADQGHEACVQALLRAKANPDLQANIGGTALMQAADRGNEACAQTLLRAKANTELLDNRGLTALQWAEYKGRTATAALIRQHTAPPPPAAAAPAAPLDAGEPAVSAPASLPDKIYQSTRRGELQKVVKWVRKGGLVDALCPATTKSGEPAAYGLLHAAATNGHLELVRELLKRGASVNLQGSRGGTALVQATAFGHLPIVLQYYDIYLLQYSFFYEKQYKNVKYPVWKRSSRADSGHTSYRYSHHGVKTVAY